MYCFVVKGPTCGYTTACGLRDCVAIGIFILVTHRQHCFCLPIAIFVIWYSRILNFHFRKVLKIQDLSILMFTLAGHP